MGCSASKSVASSRATSLVSLGSRGKSGKKTAVKSAKSAKGGKHSSNPGTSAQTTGAGVEQFAVFGQNYEDVPGEGVQNAKPKLPRSAIGRGSCSYNDPITPVIEAGTSGDLHHSKFEEGSTGILDLSNLSGYTLDTLSDVNQNEKDVTETPEQHSKPPELTGAEKNTLEPETMRPELNNSALMDYNHMDDGKEDEFSVLNVSKNNLTLSRASSAKAGSFLTTAALNASFATTHDDDLFSELALGTPLTDYDESLTYRTSSITPSAYNSEDTTPVTQLSKQFGPIIEEFEGGFTPRSTTNGETIPTPRSSFLPREVFEHNRKVGWHEWSVYKGKVYDTNSLKNVFKPLIYAAREEREAQIQERKREKEEENSLRKDDEDYDSDSDNESVYSIELIPQYDLEQEQAWNRNGVIFILTNGLAQSVLTAHLPQCCIGVVERPGSPRYWKDVREDVKTVLNDLIREDMSDHISAYASEYMQLLQRWMSKYRDNCPAKTQLEQGDPNTQSFPLPEEIAESPDCLRNFLESWKMFEMEVPEEGAWDMAEVAEFDLGDAHEIFLATLRSHFESTPFDLDIDGEAGWNVIQENLIAEDTMTADQLRVAEERSRRTDLDDPRRMKRRRQRLLSYFVKKYEMDRSKVEHFLKWAEEMENDTSLPEERNPPQENTKSGIPAMEPDPRYLDPEVNENIGYVNNVIMRANLPSRTR